MKKIRKLSILLILCLIFSIAAPEAFALDDPAVDGKTILLADADTGRILYSRNIHEKVAPASLTKVMTILLAVEQLESGAHSQTEIVTAPADCRVGMDEMSSTSGIQPGEEVSFQDLIYCAMLDSANEACNCLAVAIDGSISAFVERMNARAAELGMTSTHFANTNGLTDSNHYSTAYDFYLLTREAMTHELFKTVCNTATHTVPATNMAQERTLNNSNALISAGSIYGSNYLYEYASGVKTGYTSAAGYCLISTAAKGDIHAIAIVMGCEGPNNSSRTDHGNFVDSITLYNWLFNYFEYRTVLTTSDVEDRLPVAMAEGGAYASLRPASDVTLLLPKDTESSAITTQVTRCSEDLTAPIAAGTELGELTVSVNGEEYCTVKLITYTEIQLSRVEYLKQQLHQTFGRTWVKLLIILLVLVFLIYIALVLRYRALRRRHLKQKRLAEQRRREERERLARQRDRKPDQSDPD